MSVTSSGERLGENHAEPGTSASSTTELEQRARALELEVERRRRLEDRMGRLLELTGQLSAAQTASDVARVITETGMQTVGASAAALWVLSSDKQHLELAAQTSTAPRSERYDRMPVTAETPLNLAVRDQEPVFIGSLAEYAARFPASLSRIADVDLPPHVAFALLPVIGDDGPVGGICFTYDHERVFGEADRNYKQIVARHCALALERAHMHEQERLLREAAERAQAESELLYQLTSEMSVADDLEGVYQTALRIVEAGTTSDRSAILLFDPDDVMRFKASHGLSERYRAAVEGHSPWTPDELAPQAICVADAANDPAWAAYRDVFAAEGIGALAFVPLVHRRTLVGKFVLYRNHARAFTAREIQLAATVAFHVGEAIARKTDELALAAALAEEKQAHETAEEATRAREEIISVVSHDLRSPLGAILLGASALLQIDTERGHRSTSIAGRIHRQAERMARLIEDLVDFAGIQAGKLVLARTPHKPDEIVHAATDMFSPMAAERGLTLDTNVQPDLPAVSCDSDRAIQVISNLVSNAIKVTPKGGHVTIGTETRDTDVVFYVRDDGPGIDATELPRLFERYWRGKTSPYRGAGLGLSIARGIVDAHGGRIWVESKLGAGSTFYFSLSARN